MAGLNDRSKRIHFDCDSLRSRIHTRDPGESLGHDRVLAWLLDTAAQAGTRRAFAAAIQETCLAHVPRPKDRRDMASHVMAAMRSYQLIEADHDRVSLSEIGRTIQAAKGAEQDRLFARHILISCGGQRLVETILQYQIRGERALLEDLARQLEGQPTSKNISAMRAWLGRAGLFEGRGYRVDQDAVRSLLGLNVAAVYALRTEELQLVIAIRLLEQLSGADFVRASEAASLAESRNPELRLPRKALGKLVKALAERSVLEVQKERGAGGTGWAVRLLGAARELTADELTSLVRQSAFGFGLHELLPLEQVLAQIGEGTAYERGIRGEMLAVHLCLALGLRVESWRSRSPASEIDLLAERTAGLTYQRWSIQVKNTGGRLDIDRVDREIGATAGLGVTHILFIVPRATVTGPARAEMMAKGRITGLQLLFLGRDQLAAGVKLETLVSALASQVALASQARREEARRRERGC